MNPIFSHKMVSDLFNEHILFIFTKRNHSLRLDAESGFEPEWWSLMRRLRSQNSPAVKSKIILNGCYYNTTFNSSLWQMTPFLLKSRGMLSLSSPSTGYQRFWRTYDPSSSRLLTFTTLLRAAIPHSGIFIYYLLTYFYIYSISGLLLFTTTTLFF